MGHTVLEKHVLQGLLNVMPVGRSSSELITSESQNFSLSFATFPETNQDKPEHGIF